MPIDALPAAPDSSDRENFPTQMDTFLAALITFRTQVNATAAALGVDATTLLGTGIGDWLTTPSSANLRAALTDETGSGSAVFGTAPTIDNINLTGSETVEIYALSTTTPVLEPDNGLIQTWTLTGASTPTESIAAGQWVLLMIDDGSAYTITWPSVTWVVDGASAPTLALTGYTAVLLWKVGSTLYGKY